MTDPVDEAIWREARRQVVDGGLRIDGFGQIELRRRAKTSTSDPVGVGVTVDAQPTFVPDPQLAACVAGGAQAAAYEAARVVHAVATAMAIDEAEVAARLDRAVREAVRSATDRARPRPRPLGTLGIFHVREFPEYETRNPRGGDPIRVPAKRVAGFRVVLETAEPVPAAAVDAALAAWNGDVDSLRLPGPLSPDDQIRVIDHVAARLGDGWTIASDAVIAALPL